MNPWLKRGPYKEHPSSAKQDAARTRNWCIRNLRALHALCYSLSPERRAIVQEQIDDELAARGALRTSEHKAAEIAKSEKRSRSLPDDIPF